MSDKISYLEMQICEACGEQHIFWNLECGSPAGGKYVLCSDCLFNLVTYSLSKDQLISLLFNNHTREEIWLCDDYYDEQGNQLQSQFTEEIEEEE